MPPKTGYPSSLAPVQLPLVKAHEGKGDIANAKSAKATAAFVEKLTRSNVSEEWTKVDDRKIAKLRGILAALQEENQSTQLLKKESEDKEARKALEATRSTAKEALFLQGQADLRRHVLENQKSLQELEAAIEKGEKKAKEEQLECRRLDSEISALEEELREQEETKAAEQRKIHRTSVHKHFLETVVQYCVEDFEGDIEVLMNRHTTLEAGNQELNQANFDLTKQLDRIREECLRVQTKLQNEHLMISSKLHECQVDLDRHRAECQELEGRLNRALEEKELKESQVGVIQMAIEQLFTRTVTSCRLKQRKKAMLDATDIKYAPVRGDKSDTKLEEMFRQITERVEDLMDIRRQAMEVLDKGAAADTDAVVEQVDLSGIKFVQERVQRRPEQYSDSGPNSPTANSTEDTFLTQD